MTNDGLKSYYGSGWRRWDLHIHTPTSYTWEGAGNDTAYKEIIKKMNESDVAVFAITDYWTFDGFKKLMEINAELPETERLKKVIFPGIELRFDILTDEANPNDKTRVNFQAIFNNDDGNGLYRANQFYSQLKLSSTQKVISKESFIEIAKDYSDDVLQKLIGKKRKQCKNEDYLDAGYRSCYISYDCLSAILNNEDLRENIFIIVPWDKYGGISKIDPILRDDTKKKLTKLSNALESTKDETIKLFLLDKELLTSKTWAESWEQFLDDKEKPCICGSDAKRVESIGLFPNDKTCWIKADTTYAFEGLKQIIYEPKERVYIGNESPSAFKHSIVSSFSVSKQNDKFFLKKIGSISLSDGLNCVIGPRGAGKSALLDAVAFSLGDNKVLNQERNNYIGFFFKRNDTSIVGAVVKNSYSGESKKLTPSTTKGTGFVFDYYHQKHIGYLADPNNEEILSRFLFDKIFKEGRGLDSLFSELNEKKDDVSSKLAINREQIVACTKEIVKESETKTKIQDKNSRADFLAQEEIKHLLDERAKIIKLRERINRIKARIEKLDENPLVVADEIVDIDFFSELLLSPIDPEGTIISEEWKKIETSADTFIKGLDKDKEKIKTQIEKLTKRIIELEPSFDFNTRLTGILEQIKAESAKKGITITIDDLEKIDLIQKEISALEEQLKIIGEKKTQKTNLLAGRSKLLTEYKEHLNRVKGDLENNFSDLLKKDGAILNDTIKLEVKTNLPLESYSEIIETKAQHNIETETPRFPAKKPLLELFNTLTAEKVIRDLRNGYFDDWNVRGFGAGSLEYFQKMLNREEVAMYLEEFLPSLTAHLLWRPDSTRDFKLLKKCSIGERGTALLSVILITGREPLIIDQPEDDLDHFYLYKTLTPIIKEVKKRRQLIFATHDANIVINGDAELILIITTNDGKFGDVSLTSIENLDNRDWVMKILEGGRDAFRKRREKYGKKAE